MWVIDGNNVMGAGADGWWKDPISSAITIAESVAAWCADRSEQVVLVFDGRPEPRLTALARPNLDIDFARRPGRDAADDQIVRLVEEHFAEDSSITVVTSDRGLTDRLPPGVTVIGAGSFRSTIGLPRPGRRTTGQQTAARPSRSVRPGRSTTAAATSRIAVFSDIHGNAIALDAVLADTRNRGVDAYWIVGDIVANGPDPAAVVDCLRRLPNATFVLGNTDRYVLTGDLAGIIPPLHPSESDSHLAALVAATSAHAWTRGCLTASDGAYDWLASLPIESRETLPDGTRTLLVHAAPGRDDGPGITTTMTDAELISNGWRDVGADLIFVGHTHQPLERVLDRCRIVNVGSVSLPATPDPRAMWTQLEATAKGYTLTRRFVPYDQEEVARRVDQVHHPTPAWLKRKLTSP